MLMEMKLFSKIAYKDETHDLSVMNLEDFRGITVTQLENGVVVKIDDPNNVELYDEIRRLASKNEIPILDRKRFFASFSKLVTEKMVNSYDNHIDPYFTNEMIGTYWQFAGNQVNTFEEAWEEIKKYSLNSGRPIEDYKVAIRVIGDDKARVV
jgi:hypothetical protein